MHKVALERRLKKSGRVPDPQRRRMNGPGDERIRQRAPDSLHRTTLSDSADCLSPSRRQRPEKGDERAAQHEQRRGHQHQDFVLRHVRRKKHFAPGMQRRNERYK
jgi:hypothetical protein